MNNENGKQDNTESCPMGCGDRYDAYDKTAWEAHNQDHAAEYGENNPDYFWGYNEDDTETKR